jgi:hypothetical protein
MFTKHALSSLVALVLIAAAVFAFRSWIEAHDIRLQLQTTLDAQKQIISTAEAREKNRAAELKGTLTQIAAQKRATQTPQQIVRELPQLLSLPRPIELVPVTPSPTQQGSGRGIEQGIASPGVDASENSRAQSESGHDSSQASSPDQFIAQLPAADLKPLYDFVQDCRACRAQLDAARADLTDERTKSNALATERDAAVRAAKGGGFWKRFKRTAKWFAIGAGFGAAATVAARR